MRGYGGCIQCESERRHAKYAKTNKQFIEELIKVHDNKYDYSKVNYYNSKTKVTLICPKHGEFESYPRFLLKGGGCPHCTRWVNQENLYQRLVNLFPSEDIRYEYNVKWLGMQRFDIYFPKYNIAVEYDGLQHFEAIDHFGGEEKFLETIRRDKLKEEKCQQNHCILFRIPYNYTDNDFEDVCSQIEIIISHKLETTTDKSDLIDKIKEQI